MKILLEFPFCQQVNYQQFLNDFLNFVFVHCPQAVYDADFASVASIQLGELQILGILSNGCIQNLLLPVVQTFKSYKILQLLVCPAQYQLISYIYTIYIKHFNSSK